MMIALALIFFAIGIVSTIVGLGGGTFYLLTLNFFDVPYMLIPIIALMCNIIVSGFGTGLRLLKKESAPPLFLMIILIPSMLFSYIGASIALREGVFQMMLNILLFLIIIARVLLQIKMERKIEKTSPTKEPEIFVIKNKTLYVKFVLISAVIGFVSGLIGIGGGIILGPVLYIYGMSYRSIPLITAIYIFLNSSVGLIAHLEKIAYRMDIVAYILLPIVCFLSTIFAMKYIRYRTSTKQVRNIAIVIILVLTVYNIIRGGIAYGF